MFTITQTGAVARLTLDRPEARNAIGSADWLGLATALGKLEADKPRVLLVLSSQAETFCAGAEFGEMTVLVTQAERRAHFRNAMRTGLDRLASLPFPVVAAIDGGCFGAGVSLALSCDVRFAGTGARFALPPAKIGIPYPRKDLRRLVTLIGTGQASRLLFGALTIDAVEAARIGLVEQAVTRALPAAEAYVNEVAAMSPSAVRLVKRMMKGEGGDAADRAFEAAFGGPDVAAFLEARRTGRAPVFR